MFRSLQRNEVLNDCKQTKAKTDQAFKSADMAAESFSPAHCEDFRTIKDFHGIPGGETDGEEREENKPNRNSESTAKGEKTMRSYSAAMSELPERKCHYEDERERERRDMS